MEYTQAIPTSSRILPGERWKAFLAHLGLRRNNQNVTPGLYTYGNPGPDSPVVVTANYILSFNIVRRHLRDRPAWILVLDTKGVNVWCAAGKGTFGTDELINRIEITGLSTLVTHRRLIVPQLGAPGVCAHKVKKATGFKVDFGPVEASDIPVYFENPEIPENMRQVYFGIGKRINLISVEVLHSFLPLCGLCILFTLLGNFLMGFAFLAAATGGLVLFPLLLPILPTPHFSTKGFILGAVIVLPFALFMLMQGGALPLWQQGMGVASLILIMTPITAFISLNFTGSSTYTSWSGVKREIKTFIPVMAWTFIPGVIMALTLRIIQLIGG
jgi:hypothetical protein